jgi:hypothetical protein
MPSPRESLEFIPLKMIGRGAVVWRFEGGAAQESQNEAEGLAALRLSQTDG